MDTLTSLVNEATGKYFEMKKTLCFLMGLILLLWNGSSIGQYSENRAGTSNGNPLSLFWNDFKYISTQSLSPHNHQEWKLLTYTSLMIFFLSGNDSEFHEEYGIERERGPLGLPKIMGDVGTVYDKPGTAYFTLGLAGAMYGSGILFKDQKLKQTTGLMFRSLIISGLFSTALKIIIGRARPYVNDNARQYKPFNLALDADYMSMPSGHTSSIFAMMTVIAKQYDSWWIKIPAYSFAVSVACQRMMNRKHWGSDLLIGGLIGYLVGDAVVKRHKARSMDTLFEPVIGPREIGIAIRF